MPSTAAALLQSMWMTLEDRCRRMHWLTSMQVGQRGRLLENAGLAGCVQAPLTGQPPAAPSIPQALAFLAVPAQVEASMHSACLRPTLNRSLAGGCRAAREGALQRAARGAGPAQVCLRSVRGVCSVQHVLHCTGWGSLSGGLCRAMG